MSNVPQGPDWWQASDDRWYPPETHPGYEPPPGQGSLAGPMIATTAGTNGFAVASLVLGILWLFGAGSILAVVFGAYAQARMRVTGEKGQGMAACGVWLGVAGIALAALFFVWLFVLAEPAETPFGTVTCAVDPDTCP